MLSSTPLAPTAVSDGAPAVTAAPKAREPYLDNAKAILIALVVVGHLIERVPLGIADVPYKWIYLFHMPAFVFLSGYLSRSFRSTPRQSLNLATALLLPYLVLNVIEAIERYARGDAFTLNLFRPGFASWYLLALLAWRVLTPLLRAIPWAVPLGVLASLAAVTYGGIGQDVSAARIVSFLPFFAAGLWLTPARLAALRRVSDAAAVRLAGLAVLVIVFVGILALRTHVHRTWFYMYGRVNTYGVDSDLARIGIRASVLVAASVMILALLAVVPRRRSWLTRVGENSLYVYMLQAMVVVPLQPRISAHHWTSVQAVLLGAGGVVLALVLGTPWVQRATGWLLDPFRTVPALRRAVERRLAVIEPAVQPQ